MDLIKAAEKYFSRTEIMLWCSSVALIAVSFGLFDGENYLTLLASFIGVTSLIFNAKGNPFGQFLMVIFSLLYGIISYSFAYYGEMITYLGMTMPMAVFALVSWLRDPYNGNKAEVRVNTIGRIETLLMWNPDGGNYCVVLFYTGILRYGQHHTQHVICNHQFSCGLSHFQKKSVFCRCLCRK